MRMRIEFHGFIEVEDGHVLEAIGEVEEAVISVGGNIAWDHEMDGEGE